ncbi:chemotaxis protein CheW [Sphingomonas sp.]|jgi:purine-binding chemotaxis protein CheW|uniref:chemotaxis protein CheW n=1 Tax=Sphingomonas sp. TaxID=28214 RepID=UPI002D809513|nr:chemotaxis protein CheW [Sphingomonas sp.]HEU0043563.1 chemotaxis protein CheW [Sphingomonas sp.]
MELFLVGHVAGRVIAVPADQVDSVVDLGEIVPVPGAVGAVRGLAALRSRVMTVVDTGLALGLEPTPAAIRRAIVTRVQGHHYAVLVDALEDVAPFTRHPLAGLYLRHGWAAAGTGLIEHDGEPVLIIDLTRLLPGVAAPDTPALAA